MLQNKQNVFDDFYAAAEWLIAERYTRPGRLGIAGGSNGYAVYRFVQWARLDQFQGQRLDGLGQLRRVVEGFGGC